MTTDQLKLVIGAQPFSPFALRMADGRALFVSHQEFISIDPRGRTAAVWTGNGGCNLVDIMLVTDIEFSPPAERPGGGNGATPKR